MLQPHQVEPEMKKKYAIAMLPLAASCAASLAAESLWLPSILSENMVLQREMTVPVWGRARPGAPVIGSPQP